MRLLRLSAAKFPSKSPLRTNPFAQAFLLSKMTPTFVKVLVVPPANAGGSAMFYLHFE